jgi:hypothetical protein
MLALTFERRVAPKYSHYANFLGHMRRAPLIGDAIVAGGPAWSRSR